MKSNKKNSSRTRRRKDERGAALITMLLVSILLLSAGLALVTSTSLSTTNSIDATAEMQAYSAAEAGLEAVLHVLRGNVAPDSSLGSTKMNFRNAANPATANKTSDPWRTGTGATSRLSGWLNYSYQSTTVPNDWRVPLTSPYAPNTGIAYKIVVTDPDDPGPIATRQITTDATYRPTQLVIQSEGFGPKGAVKRLEMIVTFSAFDFTPPASITLPGGPGLPLNLGDSAEVEYSGDDLAGSAGSIPALSVASDNVPIAQGVIDGMHDDAQVNPGTPGTLTADNTPSFLSSATAARSFLAEMRGLADTSNRLFSTQEQANDAGGLGTTTSPRFTFIDNYGGEAVNLGANHQGSGLLIVTGDLLTHGNTDFEGVILVMGSGNLLRDGGGEGVLRGAIVVANFDPNGTETTLGPPTFAINGGGNSTIAFDSLWVRRAMDLTGLRVKGIREYH